ncbi:MAG: hypothetical protein M1338_00230, partial [Patescibacteria group bacterium]|nr:hypothetical protein [Patescibacteria group bacterium]
MFVEQRGSSIFDEKETKRAYLIFLLLTAFVLIAGLLTGCGGGSGTSTVQTTDPLPTPTSTFIPTPTPTGHSPSPSPTPPPMHQS